MATNTAREERRRRIAERGSERMALITGRVQSLPPPPPPPSPSLPPRHVPQPHHHVLGSTLETLHEVSNEVLRQKNVETETQDDPESCKCDTTTNTMQSQLGFGSNTKNQPLLDTSIAQRAPNIDHHTEPAHRHRKRTPFFTSKRLNSCIVASENTRILCALIVAFLVVLSYVDYALFGMNLVNSDSVVASRPVYIILLTDATIVLARFLYFESREEEAAEEELRGSPQDHEGHNWVAAVKLLERGLVVYQAIRGVFIDFSVYTVVVICGLSLGASLS